MSTTFETFKPIDYYHQSNLIQSEPSSFNGMVRVVKYRVTIDEVEEADEVIKERIQNLWNANTKRNNVPSLLATAKKYGLELQ